jgi:lysine-N-methylase
MATTESRLSLTVLPLPAQRYSCHGCGNCCRDFTVQLRPEDLEKLQDQHWEDRMETPITVEFRGKRYLSQRADGACVFLLENGHCRVHAEFGLEAKPLACQLFPFVFAPAEQRVMVGLSFACQSVLANQGASLTSHTRQIQELSEQVPELIPSPPLLAEGLRAEPLEASAFANALDRWLTSQGTPLATRLDGVAWLAQQLSRAKLSKVRGERFRELMGVLVDALPSELPLHPISPPNGAQLATLRQAAFFRLEDPKIQDLKTKGRLRAVLAQYMRSRAFARGRGTVPPTGDQWPTGATFQAIEHVRSPWESPDLTQIDDLFTRWMRATVLGGRAWGSGFYDWSMMQGVQAVALNAASALWLMRAHAAACGRDVPSIQDAYAAVGRVDRASGRAPWLGSKAESIRLRYLCIDDGLRRVLPQP